MARDPVCGVRFTPDEGCDLKEDYRGTTYYFCSEKCRDRFTQNPGAIRKEDAQAKTEGEVESV